MSLVAADIAEQSELLARLPRSLRALPPHRVVRLAGIGSSRHVAAYGAACFEVLAGIPTTLLASPGAGVPQPRLGPDDLLLVVSQSGETPALLDLATSSQSLGTTVIALTNSPGSTLARLADLHLDAGAGAESVVPATKSVTRSMLVLRALAGPVSLGPLAAVVDELLQTELPPSPLPSVVVGGGFAGQAVADEVALKLAEVVGHLAVAESVVDFLHGPAAVPASALAFLSADDPNAAAVVARPDVLTVGPTGRLRLPSTGDPTLDAIAQVVAGQRLALRWAQALGVDPDDARGLQKVTLTA